MAFRNGLQNGSLGSWVILGLLELLRHLPLFFLATLMMPTLLKILLILSLLQFANTKYQILIVLLLDLWVNESYFSISYQHCYQHNISYNAIILLPLPLLLLMLSDFAKPDTVITTKEATFTYTYTYTYPYTFITVTYFYYHYYTSTIMTGIRHCYLPLPPLT